MSSFECHSAFLTNLSSDPSPGNTTKKIHALPAAPANNSRKYNNMTTASATGGVPASPRRSIIASQSNKHQSAPSFADFFSASTPVPASVTLLLSYTGPAVHFVHRFLQLVTWTSDRSIKSFLLLFAWWAICLGSESFLVFGVHITLILYIGRQWIRSGKATKVAADIPLPLSPSTPQSGKLSFSSNLSNKSNSTLISSSTRHPVTSQVEQAVTLKEIQEILDHWAAWHRTLDRTETYLNWSDRSTTRFILFLVAVTYLPWLILTYFIPMRIILLVLGSVAICWRAPWFAILWAVMLKIEMVTPILRSIPYWPYQPETASSYRRKKRFSVKDIISRAIGQRKKTDSEGYKAYKTSTGYDIEEDHATMYYKFVLYENQRWWLGLEWTPMMLPNDRAPWTDDHTEPTQSKSAFQLPPPHVAHEAIPGQPNKVLRKSQEWRWLDQHWRLKHGSDLEADGWEYANNHWQNWVNKPRRGTYTRRRAWERTAKLIDQREIVSMEDIQHELPVEESEDEYEEEVEEVEADEE